MEVTQKDDHVTHAVAGASEIIEMGMSNDAALMHILSAALYTHPNLAAVREPICNAWDAHISAGLMDKPLEILIEERKLTIKDFGLGIPHDKIGEIYGVYGNSTKRNDSTVTGGFGLGSKAPFAYTDLFEVVSCHEGTKTIYRVSKSSMDRGGKPAINKVVSMPTEETGITVSFGLKEGDKRRFRDLVHEVVILGGIKAEINSGSDNVVALPLEDSPTGYLISSYAGTVTTRINLRYGNVVYPIPVHESYEKEWGVVSNAMQRLWNGANIIFMAAPNSVSIAPSRENLILTDNTVETIKNALEQFDPNVMDNGNVSIAQVVNELSNIAISKEATPTNYYDLVKSVKFNTETLKGQSGAYGLYAFNLKEAHLHHLARNIDPEVQADKRITLRLKKLIKERACDTVLAKEIIRYMVKNEKEPYVRGRHCNYAITSIRKRVFLPLYQAIKATSKVSLERLSVVSSIGWSGLNTCTLKAFRMHSYEETCGFVFKKVVIGTSKDAIHGYITRYNRNSRDNLTVSCEQDTGWFCYRSAVNQTSIDAAIKMFSELGYEVHNVCIPKQVKEVDPNAPPPAPRKKQKKRTGYLSLAQSYGKYDKTFLLSHARKQGDGKCVEPKAWVVLRNKGQHPGPERIQRISQGASQAILKLLGDDIAVVTDVQSKILSSKGVPELKEFINKYVDEKLSASKEFGRYLAFASRAQDNAACSTGEKGRMFLLMKNMCMHEDLMQQLGLRFNLSPETALLVNFAEEECYEELPLCEELKAKVKSNPLFDKVFEGLQTSPWNSFVSFSALKNALDSANVSSESTQLAKRIIAEMLPFKKLHSKKVAT